MRYSADVRLEPTAFRAETNKGFFSGIQEATTADERRCGILLVGARDYKSILLRHAQACLRWDRRPSYWSHAALVLGWPDSGLSSAHGVEVTLEPEDSWLQVPEWNGVTTFRLARYLDQHKYPNLCFAAVSFLPAKGAKHGGRKRRGLPAAPDPKVSIEHAARQPNLDRLRYPFWDWLGVWSRYAHSPQATPNPVVDSVPIPGAALCEYAFEAGALDLTPGATAPNATPEHFWSTLRFWSRRLDSRGATVRAWKIIGDPETKPHDMLKNSLPEQCDLLRNLAGSSS